MTAARALAAAALAAAVAATAAAPARAQPADPDELAGADYDPSSRAWNGMATFARVVEGLGYELTVARSLDWPDLGAEDILVLVYPLRRIDPGKIAAFVQAGGHVLIADDFGEAGDALGRLGLLRGDVGTPRARRYHDARPWAPVADVVASHEITRGVTEVVTNHPAVLTSVEGADALVGFAGGDAVVVAGVRGTGRFVVLTDPSVLINRMLQFPGNLTLAANMLRWLDRDGRARRVVLVYGDAPMYGEPRRFIDDAGASPFDRRIHALNFWLAERSDWLLTLPAARALALLLAIGLAIAAAVVLPSWRRTPADGRWLRVDRPGRKDDVDRAVGAADAGADNYVVAATVLRDLAQLALARVTGVADPLFTLGEAELVRKVTEARGRRAGDALARVHRRLRALPSRTQAAAPWSGAHLGRREFERLHDDVMELYEHLDADHGGKAR